MSRFQRPAFQGLVVGVILATVGTLPCIAESIGQAESITNRVIGEQPGQRRVLVPAADVFRNEVVRTEVQANARLRFSDRSDLYLGPQAQIRLDAAVFSGNPGSAMALTRGALRFVSGNGPVGSYQIRTPVATIGLRGTGVEVVLRSGRAYVTLLHGAARVCGSGRGCADLTNRCEYDVAGGGRVQPARPLTIGVPTYNSTCSGDTCAAVICGADATTGAGYNPSGNAAYGGGGGGSGGGGGGGSGTR